MGNRTLNIIALLILVAVVGFVVFNLVNKATRSIETAVANHEDFQPVEISELMDMDMVIVTFDDNLYHVKGCPRVRGPSEKMILRAAVRSGAQPCPYCIIEGE